MTPDPVVSVHYEVRCASNQGHGLKVRPPRTERQARDLVAIAEHYMKCGPHRIVRITTSVEEQEITP